MVLKGKLVQRCCLGQEAHSQVGADTVPMVRSLVKKNLTPRGGQALVQKKHKQPNSRPVRTTKGPYP